MEPLPCAGRLVRILCLHGHDQHAHMFRQKTGSLRKALKSTAELIYIDAPHQSSIGRTWWVRQTDPASYEGWEESRMRIQQSIQEHWPIDILLGFSQGAAAAALYCVQQHDDECTKVHSLISIAGFVPRDARYRQVFTASEKFLGLRSCHIYGEMDDIITPEQSIELSRVLSPDDQSVVVCSHGGGHMVPTLRKSDEVYAGDDAEKRRVSVLSQAVKDFVRSAS